MPRKLMRALLAASLCFSVAPLQSLAAASTVSSVTTANVVKTVSLRAEPSTSGAFIRYAKAGEQLIVLDTPNSYWLHVKDSSGQTGYVSSSDTYVEITTVAGPDTGSAQPPNGEVIKSVSFRTGPSTDASRMRYLQAGESIWITEQVNDYWYKIVDSKQVVGYVSTSSEYIKTTFTDDSETEPDPKFQSKPNATVVSSVSFRVGPDTDSERIRYLKAGEQLLIVNKTNSYWYYVQDQTGAFGYVSTSSSYISTNYVEPYKLLDPAVAAQKVIDAGMKYIGTPYEFGSNRYDTSTFDCSDFTRQSFLDGTGQLLPGDSRAQAEYVKGIGKTKTDWRQLKKGDLMFFMSSKGSSAANYSGVDKQSEVVTHVGIYLGDGRILHTYSVNSGGVRIDTIADSQWELRFLFGGSSY